MNKLRDFFDKIIKHDLFNLSASLAFYTLLSLAPLVVIVLTLLSSLSSSSQNELIEFTQTLVGHQASGVLKNIIEHGEASPDLTKISGWIALGVLLFSSSIVFSHLRYAFDLILNQGHPSQTETQEETFLQSIKHFITDKILNICLVILFVFIVAATLVFSSLLDFILSTINTSVLSYFSTLIQFTFISVLLTFIYYLIPKTKISFIFSFLSAALTTILFLLGKWAISLYLSKNILGNAYGAAGSLVMVLIWLYYSSIVLFFGAEIISFFSLNKKNFISYEEYKKRLFRFQKIILSALLIITVLRVTVPYYVKYRINNYLAHNLGEYTGSIDDFDLSILTGAYSFDGFKLLKKQSKNKPFISIDKIALSVSWRALLYGKFQGKLSLEKPVIYIVLDKNPKNRQTGADSKNNWQDVYTNLIPIKLETLDVTHGEFYLNDFDLKEVPMQIFFNNVELSAKNINNSRSQKIILPTPFKLSAELQDQSVLHANGALNILRKTPAFDLNLTLADVELTQFNGFFLKYFPFTLTTGKLNLAVELASLDRKINGYIKPSLKNVDVISKEEKFKTLKRAGYEALMATLNLFFRNGKNLTVTTKIPLYGTIDNIEFDKSEAFWKGLKNAFGKPLNQDLENSVNIETLSK
ncbi:MAG: YhjD/YihY/BrkB family envelope integrity protein [Pseudobdellovibrio sp.]